MKKYLKSKFCSKSLSLISNDLSSLNKQGINLIATFDLLQELDINKKYKISLDNIKESVKKGDTLECAFNKHRDLYPDLFITFVSLGEKYGKISEVMESISTYYNQSDFVRKKFKEALSYPMLIIGCIAILLVFLIFFMLPNLINSINVDNSTLPLTVKIMMKLNNDVRENPVLSFIKFICWFNLVPIIIIKSNSSSIRKFVESKLKLTRMLNELTTISILGTIYKSGIPLSIGLDLAIESLKPGNVRSSLEYICRCILNGESLVETMKRTEMFSLYTISMVKIGEESGALEEKFTVLENIMKEKIENYIKIFVSIIQPTMIFAMTAIILFFMLTCVAPIFTTMLGGIG